MVNAQPVFPNPELEGEYNQRLLVPEHPEIFARWERESERLRTHTRCVLNVPYGPHPRQTIDILHAPEAQATLTFIHGGYWRSLDKRMFSFVAAPFLARGISVALVGYRLCPEVQLGEVVDDCAWALDWLIENAADLELPVHTHALAGHSAGGHLAVSILTRKRSPLHLGLRAVVSLSGLFELAPLIECSMNLDLRLDPKTAAQFSPTLAKPCHAVPLHLETGSAETGAFRSQTGLLSQAWSEAEISTSSVAGANHFTIVDAFATGQSAAAAFLIEQLKRR
jgi:arylformamidase